MNVIYCIQCGKLGRPTISTGVDSEGDPACNVHRDLSVAPTAAEAPIRAHNVPAARSRFATKICECGCGEHYTPTGTKQHFAPGHKPKRPTTPKKKTADESRAILRKRTVADLTPKAPRQTVTAAELDVLRAELIANLEAIERVIGLLAK